MPFPRLAERLLDVAKSYRTREPFPHWILDGALPHDRALTLQKEILGLPAGAFDRYNNPFEQKYTLRDKYAFPPLLQALMADLTSPEWLETLSAVHGRPLVNDPDRNFWGVHIFENGDRLDIHLDAARHPRAPHAKALTLGLYLSYRWEEAYGGNLEIWGSADGRLTACQGSYAPLFNRLFLFTNTANSFHGSPDPVKCPAEARRILITLSYLDAEELPLRAKAWFVPRPGDPEDAAKDEARALRASADACHAVYRMGAAPPK